jgi:hypothetical protein
MEAEDMEVDNCGIRVVMKPEQEKRSPKNSLKLVELPRILTGGGLWPF